MEHYIKFAEDYILNEVGDDCGLVKESITDYGDVVCFYYQSKKYLETNNFSDMYVGQGPMFIIKADDRVVEYGSATFEDEALENVRKFIAIEKQVRQDFPLFDSFSTHLNLTLANESTEKSLAYTRAELGKKPL
ncbi:hypothetical protein ACLI09_15990 [Flavobacterium sp. RHBU_24]|uniref:hypothetical protein n=1 Tax=Flavobacterium sp. RHBU_24 TaxID=3391185 RepID=UPI0039853263